MAGHQSTSKPLQRSIVTSYHTCWLHMFSQAVTLLPTCGGIGKVTVVKVLSSGKQLRKLGDLQIQMVDVISECTLCVAACYGSLGSTDMMSLRFTVWLSEMSNPKLNSAPEQLSQSKPIFGWNLNDTRQFHPSGTDCKRTVSRPGPV